MIDLHMHTTYSDGTFPVIDVLRMCEEKHLSVISITDHNTCEAYFEMERMNVKDFYKGHIVVGIELNTRVAGVPIEILGYNYDYNIMKDLLKDIYISSEEHNRIEFNRLIDNCHKAGIILDDDIAERFDPNSFASVTILRSIMKYDENRTKINERSWGSIRDFYRDYMSNPNTPLFVDTSDLVPDLDTAIDLVKKSGGLVFVPHIYEYRENTPKVIEGLLQNGRIDGFECYYTTFTPEQHEEILQITKEHNLLMSGGSDFHGTIKPRVKLGVGYGDLSVPESVQEPWAEYKY